MSETLAQTNVSASPTPFRLHHFNFMCRDHENTRAFYEDVLGIPLLAFWCEIEPYGGKDIIMGHAFYGLRDGSMLAFMHHPQPEIGEPFRALKFPAVVHLALRVTAEVQDETTKKLRAAGHDVMEIDHGFVKSIYFEDPNGLTLEYSVDPQNVEEIYLDQKRGAARENMRRYLSGDYTRTNTWYHGD